MQGFSKRIKTVFPHIHISRCVTGFIYKVFPLYVHFSFLTVISYCCLPLTMSEFTGQYYSHWVDKFCPWVIEPCVAGLFGQTIENIWKRKPYI